jgi:hypothetical protein
LDIPLCGYDYSAVDVERYVTFAFDALDLVGRSLDVLRSIFWHLVDPSFHA